VKILEERLDAKAPIQLHGAGTSNPSKFFWKTMDLFEERAKLPLFMTYRAVGSSTGQAEFLGEAPDFKPLNHFGAGDIPMKSSNYQSLIDNGGDMVHLPFVMGAIAVFHSVPDTTVANPIHLDACTLAKVFSRVITTWDHADIKALNPGMTMPSQAIVVVRRVLGSSSTSGLTNYLLKSCPASWTLGAGSTIPWPEGTTEAQGSSMMSKTLETTPFAIGYVDAGHGHKKGLSEIALENFDKKYLTSKEAVIKDATFTLPEDASGDWSAVNLYDLPGPDTWPITMFSYIYIRKDCSKMDPRTAGLLKAFIDYTLSPEGQAGLESFSFAGVPSHVITKNTNTLGTVAWPTDMVTFEFETSTRAKAGASPYILSGKRKTYADVAREDIDKSIASLQVSVGGVDVVDLVRRVELLEERNLANRLDAKYERDIQDWESDRDTWIADCKVAESVDCDEQAYIDAGNPKPPPPTSKPTPPPLDLQQSGAGGCGSLLAVVALFVGVCNF
jgi:phosphate ABC transporter phosphate-binding protein